MSRIYEALAWAAFILVFAWVAKDSGMSAGAATGVIAGISGAAVASLSRNGECGRGCRA